MKFPRTWQNKKSKKKFRVMPWWECIDPIISDKDMGTAQTDGRKFKIGTIVQIGWLLENEYKVWFGMGPGVEKHFKDLGECKTKGKTK